MDFITRSERETFDIGKRLGAQLAEGMTVALNGDLGAGKTVFTRGIAAAHGVEKGVKSPTFTLVREYCGDVNIAHFDLYRLGSEEELFDVGFYEYLEGENIVIAEWEELFPGVMGEKTIHVNISRIGDDERKIKINGLEKWGIEEI